MRVSLPGGESNGGESGSEEEEEEEEEQEQGIELLVSGKRLEEVGLNG